MSVVESVPAVVGGRRERKLEPTHRALGIGAAMFVFLLVIKICLMFWDVRVKHVDPLGDVPPAWRVATFGYDMMLSWMMASIIFLLLRLSRVRRWLQFPLGQAAPFMLYAGIVLYSVASFQVARIFGEPLDIEKLRSADDLAVIRGSIQQYFDPLLLVLIVLGIAGFWILAPATSRLLARNRRTTRTWLVSSSICLVLAAAEAFGMHHIDTMGLKDNAVLFFIKNYKPPLSRIDIARLRAELDMKLAGREPQFDPLSAHGSHQSLPRDFAWSGQNAAGFNLLFIQLESTSALHVNAQTAPNVQLLAQHGVSFDNHLTTVSYTPRATYSVYYSDYLPDLGTSPRLLYNGTLSQPSLAETLKGAGYRTALFYSSFLDYADIRFLFENKGFDTLVGAREMMAEGIELFNSGGVREEKTVERLIGWIRTHEQERFFAAYLTLSPHHPYDFPPDDRPFPGDSWPDRYHNSLHYADRNVGRLVDFLRNDHLLDKTLIVVFGDHGETVLTYPVGHGLHASIEEMRSPLIISNPALFPSPLQSNLPTNHLDIAPTIVRLLGQNPPSQWFGRDILAAQVPARMQFITISQTRKFAIRDNDLFYVWDEPRDRSELFTVGGADLLPLSPTDPREKLLSTYHEDAVLFDWWAVDHHLRRATNGR